MRLLKAALLLRQAAHLSADAHEHDEAARRLRAEAWSLLRQAAAVIGGKYGTAPLRADPDAATARH